MSDCLHPYARPFSLTDQTLWCFQCGDFLSVGPAVTARRHASEHDHTHDNDASHPSQL
jgi:hypothetical protein